MILSMGRFISNTDQLEPPKTKINVSNIADRDIEIQNEVCYGGYSSVSEKLKSQERQSMDSFEAVAELSRIDAKIMAIDKNLTKMQY